MLIVASFLSVAGCSMDAALQANDTQTRITEQALEASNNLLDALQGADVPLDTAIGAVEQLREQLGDDAADAMIAALQGADAQRERLILDAAASVDRFETEMARLAAERQQILETEDGWIRAADAVKSVGATVAGLLGSPLLAGVVTAIGAIGGAVVGRRTGAERTARVIAAGRLADDDFDKRFARDAAAGRAMRDKAADAPGYVRKAVAAANKKVGAA